MLLDYAPNPRQLSGIEPIHALRSRHPPSGILVFSAICKASAVAEALHSGERGFVGKGRAVEELLTAIRVASRERFTSKAGRVQEDQQTPETCVGHEPDIEGRALSLREKEIIRCYLGGMMVSEIAASSIPASSR